jgi:hypothetical protein
MMPVCLSWEICKAVFPFVYPCVLYRLYNRECVGEMSKGCKINYVLLVIDTNWNLCNSMDSLFDNRNVLFNERMTLIDITQIKT